MLSNARTGSNDFWRIMSQLARRKKGSKRIVPFRNVNYLLVYADDPDKSATMISFLQQ